MAQLITGLDPETLRANAEHVREAIAICKEMITKYGFTTAAFNDISKLAKKCGSPTQVLNVLVEDGVKTVRIKLE